MPPAPFAQARPTHPPVSLATPQAPAASILLPVFNGERFLADCLRSISAQTLTDWELIAVDDGSTDGTPAILRAWQAKDGRIRVLTQAHHGIVAGLNAGLALCRATYIARMDCDDRMHPGRLERQRACLEQDPDLDLVGCTVIPRPLTGPLRPGAVRYSTWLSSHTTPEALGNALFIESPLAHSSFFARRRLYEELAGYRDVPWPEDYDFLLRGHAAGARFGSVAGVPLERGDWPGRVTRTDPRCTAAAMDRAKVHHLVSGPWLRGKNGVTVVGDGGVAARVAGMLAERGVRVTARTCEAFDPVLKASGMERVLWILCINHERRCREVQDMLDRAGWNEGADYLRFR